MTKGLLSLRSRLVAACGAFACLLVGFTASPAFASRPPSIDTTDCVAPVLSQPFLSIKDRHWYTLAPGQTVDNFDGSGWTLDGGAQIQTKNLADGLTGSVLDLPSGARAVSPKMCVNTGFRSARTMVRNVTGTGGVSFRVSYEGTKTWSRPKHSGRIHGKKSGWSASRRMNIKPSNVSGWQLVHFIYVADAKHSDVQLSNFYIDPRMKG
ncbi:MAG: hypothetical protein QOJ01_2321 [Solirubrobacterales bacterium]|jgi:hypothetical protein|nr:hypothetical protein [Solirubrobacterales bacterium]